MLSIKHVFYGPVEAFRTLKGCPLKDSVAGNRDVHVNYGRAQPLLMFFLAVVCISRMLEQPLVVRLAL